MNTVEKGNRLEDDFFDYLRNQKDGGELVFGTYSPELCKIYKKKNYYCQERKRDINFDVVVELRRKGATEPHLFVVFECKNHEGSIQETAVTDLSDKIGRLFRDASKGVMVVSSRLQSGAENLAKSRNIGIVKFDADGIEFVAERKGGIRPEQRFVKSQIFSDSNYTKSLKFSAFDNGRFFGSFDQFLRGVDPNPPDQGNQNNYPNNSVPFVPSETIQCSAQKLLDQIEYKSGSVDLGRVCNELSLELKFSEQTAQDADGNEVLGSANFDRKSIEINYHDNEERQRFTIAHEVGHFYLGHEQFLRSETIIAPDLFAESEATNSFNYDRLEFQANLFASDLLLPSQVFETKTRQIRNAVGILDRGHGFIYVDNQPWNYGPYSELLSNLSFYFKVSSQAIEIKLKRMEWLTDDRRGLGDLSGITRRLVRLKKSEQ